MKIFKNVAIQIDINILNQIDKLVEEERNKILNSKLPKRRKRELINKINRSSISEKLIKNGLLIVNFFGYNFISHSPNKKIISININYDLYEKLRKFWEEYGYSRNVVIVDLLDKGLKCRKLGIY